MNENKEQLTENKIIILYILNEISLPVASLQLTDILTVYAFMNYFSQREAIGELIETSMLKEHIDETRRLFYILTDTGKAALSALPELLPLTIKQNFDTHKNDIRKNIKRAWEIGANHFIGENDAHYVRCFVRDGNDNNSFLIDITLLAGSKKLANEMCVKWKRSTEEIYSSLIGMLLN